MPPFSTATSELLDADFFTVKSFPNSNNDHCDLGFIVIAGDVVRRPSRGHEVSMEDLRSKGDGGVCGPP